GHEREVDRVRLAEDIRHGQQVEDFVVEAFRALRSGARVPSYERPLTRRPTLGPGAAGAGPRQPDLVRPLLPDP
ncbi:hypothetical protein ABZ960_44040, partial [Streptomyces pseudovenezuelae]|uniref:hypothetical protein n=1 Tax=Streptomyces pseudovenezuelae TaxID=67350 RepID=UPI0034A1F14E